MAYYFKSNKCIAICPLGNYGDIASLSCLSCPGACLTCFGGSVSKCYTCASNYYLIYGTSICNANCPAGQYANSTNNQCMLCASQCITCINSSSTCLSCGFSTLGANFFFYNNQCLLNCPLSYWPNSATFTCDVCNPACIACTNGSINSCSICNNVSSTIYYKVIGANTCSTTCPNGQFISSSKPNYCQACSSVCITCVNTA